MPPAPSPSDNPFERRPANLPEAESQVARIGALLAAAGLGHRNPPPPPTTCCGRGCNGCVWEGYYAALVGWKEDARELLARGPVRTWQAA